MRYAFIKAQEETYPVRRLCSVMAVHPSGYYAWRTEPESARAIDDRRLLGRIKQSWLESGSIYGYRKRRHGNNNRLSPVEFERQYFSTLASV